MKKVDNLLTLKNKKYGYMIMSTSYEVPIITNEEEIEGLLKERNYKGKVLLDLLLKNGTGANRYFKLEFDGEKLITESIENVKVYDDNIRKLSSEYYRRNYKLLSMSVLSEMDKISLLKGVTL